MGTKALAATAVLVGSASMAAATTVVLDFNSGVTTGEVGSDTAGDAATGTWRDQGFVVEWDYFREFIDTPGAAVPSDFNDFTFLSDFAPGAGVGGYGTEMTVTREGGETFSLKGASTEFTYEGLGVLADVFFSESGRGDSIALPLLRPNLLFEGVTESGDMVASTAMTASEEAFRETGLVYSFGPGEAVFAPRSLDDMTDLISLTISVLDPPSGDPAETDAFFKAAAALALEEFGADQAFLDGLDACGFAYCEIDDLGGFFASYDFLGSRNDASAVDIGSLTFHVGPDAVSSPAPVPLPAAAWMLLAGVGALVVTRRRHRS